MIWHLLFYALCDCTGISNMHNIHCYSLALVYARPWREFVNSPWLFWHAVRQCPCRHGSCVRMILLTIEIWYSHLCQRCVRCLSVFQLKPYRFCIHFFLFDLQDVARVVFVHVHNFPFIFSLWFVLMYWLMIFWSMHYYVFFPFFCNKILFLGIWFLLFFHSWYKE